MEAGEHKNVINQGRDINGREMMHCQICRSTINSFSEESGLRALTKFKCVPNCDNCMNLRRGNQPIPMGGQHDDVYHTCPICGARWWQFNTHFHLWAQVE